MAVHHLLRPTIIYLLANDYIEIWSCLELLLILAERLDFLERLPKADIDVIVPDPGCECPLCSSPYPRDNLLSDDGPEEISALQLPCRHILCWTCVHGILQVHRPGSIPCPFCRAEISTKPPDEFDFRPGMGIMPAPWTMLFHALKTYLALDPEAESMAQMIAWVNDIPRFQADVADVTLRSMIKATVQEWEHRGPYMMWGLYLTAMGKDINDYLVEETFGPVVELEAGVENGR